MNSEKLEVIGVVVFVATLLAMSAFVPSFIGFNPSAGDYQPTLSPSSAVMDVGQSINLVVTSVSSSSLGGSSLGSSLGSSSLTGSSLSSSYTFYWYINGSYDASISGPGMVSYTFTPTGAGVYAFYVITSSISSSSLGSSLSSSLGSSLSGTSSPSNTVNIVVNPAPVAEINGQKSASLLTTVSSVTLTELTVAASVEPGTGTGPFDFYAELSVSNEPSIPSSSQSGWSSSSLQTITYYGVPPGATYYVFLFVEDTGVSSGSPSPLVSTTYATATLTSVATIPQYQVTVSAVNGTSSPTGTASYAESYALPLTATPTSSSYVFTSWTTTNSQITIVNPLSLSTYAIIGGSGTITANFEEAISTSTVSTTVSSSGTSTTSVGSATIVTSGATPGSLSVTVSVLTTTSGPTTSTPTGTSSISMTSVVVVLDLKLTSTSTTGTVTLSYTSPSVTSSTQILYWNGASWSVASDITVVGTTVSGKIPIADLTATPIMIGTVFTAPPPPPVTKYNATFEETGLPSGAPWYVNITGQASSGPIVTGEYNVSLPSGNYTYSVSSGYKVPVSNETFKPVVSTGTLVLNKTVVVAVKFEPVTFAVTFTESGLPTGTLWYLNVTNMDGVKQSFTSTSTTISFSEPNGTYSYAVASSNSQYGSPPGSFKVNGAAVNVSVTFTQAKYSVVFTESGLPTGTTWSVTLNGQVQSSTTPTMTFTEPNGVYSYSVGNVSGYFLPSSTGSVTVNNANVALQISYEKLQKITVSETGLPTGTEWFFNVTNAAGSTQSFSSSSTTVSFQEVNGTYSYTVATPDKVYYPSPSSGTLMVTGTETLSVTFSPVTYSSVFTETGLPSGTSWSVTFNGVARSTTSSSISFTATNGTYQFAVSSISGYSASIYSGSVTINGASVTTSISWTLVTYQITISQTGIPSGTSWSATLTGTTFNNQSVNLTQTSTSGQIIFTEPNGTYQYAVHLPAHFSGTNLTGSLKVVGASVSATVTAKKIPVTNYTLYIVIGVIIVIVIALIAVLLVVMRRKK